MRSFTRWLWALLIVLIVCISPAPAAGDDEQPEDEDEDAQVTTSDDDWFVTIMRGTQPTTRKTARSQSRNSKQYEVVPACGLGGSEICASNARCPDGSLMYYVYAVTTSTLSEVPQQRRTGSPRRLTGRARLCAQEVHVASVGIESTRDRRTEHS